MRRVFLVFILFFPGMLISEESGWSSFDFFPPMNVVYHPVSTDSKEAQKFFDLGLLALYSFNHDLSYRFFEKSKEYDRELAMAYWGMAMALGENINRQITSENEKKAYSLVRKALLLSAEATENEQEYIFALAKRYSNDPNIEKMSLTRAYKDAMEKLVAKFPDDLDAATLYCESMMNLRPWHLWNTDKEPEPGTLEILEILESVLKRNPQHIGANHYYIHAVEASNHPERALICANRLNDLLPEWGHMLHMPSHIYILVGDYEKSVQANKKAIKADLKYIEQYGLGGYYPIHYLSHNFFFLFRSYLWQERYEKALETAQDLESFLYPHIEQMPELEYYLMAPLQTYLYNHKWEEILQFPKPKETLFGLIAFWHFARSMAYIQKREIVKGEREKNIFLRKLGSLSQEEKLGFNSAKTVLSIAERILNASFAKAKGNASRQITLLKQAVAEQDKLHYNEPPDWFYPLRQTLGAALLEIQQAEIAEDVFRQALERLPRNGRSLFGLWQALKVQDKSHYWVEREMRAALNYAEEMPSLSSL